MKFNLSRVRSDVVDYYEQLQDREAGYGVYRSGIGKRHDLYATLDVALIRTIMGEDLLLLPEQQRQEWVAHIHSYKDDRARDGRYKDILTAHSALHANGMVIGALSVLGGKQPMPKLYDAFKQVDQIEQWLDQIDWSHQWGASHLFWGGMHCFSFSKACSPEWIDCVIHWLNDNLDEKTGWWRKGVPHADRHQPLGGSVHILPIYQHHNRAFPYPEQLIDSVLAMQLPSGRWRDIADFHIMHYMELDALYALRFMQHFAPEYRKDDIRRQVMIYAEKVVAYYQENNAAIYRLHPHDILAIVGIFGLLQQLMPDVFLDDVEWTDIFSDPKLYRVAEVEQP